MWNLKLVCLELVFLSLLAGNFHLVFQQDQNKTTIRRVKRPIFSSDDWQDLYFDDVYKEALVGDRPDVVEKSKLAGGEDGDGNQSATSESKTGFRWSRYISRDSIEDEVKRIHQTLRASIKTPSGFNGKIGDVRQSFEMLSVLFAIIHEFDQEIRWKKFASTAQALFADATLQARQPSKAAFENSKFRKDDLGELIRGGGIELDSNSPAEFDWSNVIGRRSIMIHLESSLRDQMKAAVANQNEFETQREMLVVQGNLVSALAQVLIKEEMDDADDEEYRKYSIAMGQAASQMVKAAENDEFESVSQAMNKLEQSCNDCHADWR